MGRKRLERVSESGRVDKTKSPRLHLFKKSCMCGTTPDMRGVLDTRANNTPIQSKQLGWRIKTTKAPQNTQPLRSLFGERSNVIFPRKITRKRNSENIENRCRHELSVFEDDVIVVWNIVSRRKIEELSF